MPEPGKGPLRPIAMAGRAVLALTAVLASVWATGCASSGGGCQRPAEGPGVVITSRLHDPHYRLLIDQAVTLAVPARSSVRLTDPTLLTLHSTRVVGGTLYQYLYAAHVGSADVEVSGSPLTRIAVVCRL